MGEVPKNLETKVNGHDQEKKQNKQVWQIVEDIYGQGKWKELAPKLAAKFGIQNYTRTAEQNMEIANRLQKGERLESENTKNKIENFDTDKQKLIREHIGDININYLTNLENKDIQKLNAIQEPSAFLGFLREQKEKIKELVSNKKTDESVNNEAINNAVASVETMEFDERLSAFFNKAKQAGDINAEDMKNARAKAALKANTANEDDIKKAGGKEELQRQLERMELLAMAKEKGLDQKYGPEFDDLVIDLCKIQKDSPWLEKFWDKELLEYAKDRILTRFDRVNDQSGDVLDKQKNIIMNQKVMQEYMQDTTGDLTNIVEDENMKDDAYRESIKKKYDPTMGNMIKNICMGDEKFFDGEAGKLKSDVSIEDKKRLEPKLKLIQKEYDNAEKAILGVWNPARKKQGLFTCIDILRSCMKFSISDSDQKTLLASLENVESNAMSEGENRVLEIKCKAGDKKLTVYYNLTTGTVETQKFLKKDKKAEAYYLADANEANAERCREKIPLLQLPKLSDFGQKVKDRGPEGRKELVMGSENIAEMEKNLATKLDRDVKADYMVDINPSYFEKATMQNMFTQEVLGNFMKFPGGQFPSVGSDDEGYFELLGMINNAANRYTKDELKRGIETIKDMQNSKKRDIIYSPGLEDTNPIKNMKKNNPEKYFFEMAFSPDVVDKPGYRGRPKENTFLKFFQCFKSPKSDSFPMMDLDMLADYQGKLGKKINTQEENNMARKRNQTFNKNMEGIETQLTAENTLEEYLNTADDKNLA